MAAIITPADFAATWKALTLTERSLIFLSTFRMRSRPSMSDSNRSGTRAPTQMPNQVRDDIDRTPT